MRFMILLSFLLALILTGFSLQEQEDVVSVRETRVPVRKMMRGLKKMRKSGKSSSRAVLKGKDCDFIK